MGSAKTTGALHAARRYIRMDFKVTLLRPKISLRSHEKAGLLVTKNNESFPAIDIETFDEILPKAQSADVVWFDEIFLFPEEDKLFPLIQNLRRDKDILVSSLGADAKLSPFFKSMPQLLAVADDVIVCKADCDYCGAMGKATRTLFCADSSADIKTGDVFVGGTEAYIATCPECWSLLMELPPKSRRKQISDTR
jgi:thymidine kinase